MKTIAVLDACVLFPMPLCDTLLRMAEQELYLLQFSQDILKETTRNLVKKNRMKPEKEARYQEHIKRAFPESLVTGYEKLIPLMTNDPKDRHVLACAVRAKADVIVTYNLKDFPLESAELFGVTVKHPDDFLLDLISEHGMVKIVQILNQQAKDLKKPPIRLRDLIQRFKKDTPDFYSLVVGHFYVEKMNHIANEIVSRLGKKLQNSSKFFQGSDYYIELNNNYLLIKHKDRGQILRYGTEYIEADFTIEDLEKFEAFERAMNEQFSNYEKLN